MKPLAVLGVLVKVGITALVTFIVPVFTLGLVNDSNKNSDRAGEYSSCEFQTETERVVDTELDPGLKVFYVRVKDRLVEIWSAGPGGACVAVVKELPEDIGALKATDRATAQLGKVIAEGISEAMAIRP